MAYLQSLPDIPHDPFSVCVVDSPMGGVSGHALKYGLRPQLPS